MADAVQAERGAKRQRESNEVEENGHAEAAGAELDIDDDDDDVGPMPMPESAGDDGTEAGGRMRKKRKGRSAEAAYLDKVFLEGLPSAGRYYRSFMHRDSVSWLTVSKAGYLMTASVDGHLKFWKKRDPDDGPGIEFVKHYRAHLSPILSVSASADGSVYATAAADASGGSKGSVKVFDVQNFDMINMIKLPFAPLACCWVHRPGQAATVLAISDQDSPTIYLYDGRAGDKPLAAIPSLHRASVHLIAYNPQHDCVISADTGGMLEYWQPSEPFEPPSTVRWSLKSQTDLYEFKKRKTVPASISVSPTGQHFVTTSMSPSDHQIRIFAFDSGKLLRVYDEGITAISEMQQAGTAAYRLDDMEFGRRLAVERELEKTAEGGGVPGAQGSAVFDESGTFVIYPTLLGVKVVNIHTNKTARILGRDENNRFLQVALFQGSKRKNAATTIAAAASDNPMLQEKGAADPTLFCTAFKRSRFYFFNKLEPESDATSKHTDRDIFNEKPTREEQSVAAVAPTSRPQLASSAVIHTTRGDIHCRLFPDLTPKTVENFVGHAKSGYYEGIIFHRVIKKFMLQTGDPFGDGTGGESIWGGNFEDEFHPSLKHDRPYCLSMANAGPGTNGSQFFITVVPTPWLDNKHTIFGRCTGGMNVIHDIEGVRCDKSDKPLPEYEVKITSISVDGGASVGT